MYMRIRSGIDYIISAKHANVRQHRLNVQSNADSNQCPGSDEQSMIRVKVNLLGIQTLKWRRR